MQRDEAELARVARRAGDDHALRVEQRAEVLGVDAQRHTSDLDERVDGDRAPSTTISGLTSTRTIVGIGLRRAASESRGARRRTAARSTAGSPRNGPSSAWVDRSVDHLLGVDAVDRDEAERTSAIASARTPPTPSITPSPNWGSGAVRRSARGCPAPSARRAPDRAVLAGRRASSSAAAASTAPHVARGRGARARVRSCARSRRRRA